VIDFRYHLVSIIAVFLALAIGLLVGATSLSGATEDVLRHAEQVLTQQNAALRAENKQLARQVGADQAFAQAGSRRLLDGVLAGEKVVLVVPPGADGAMQQGVTTALQQAGATVTAKVTLQQSFFDTGAQTESSLSQLVRQLAPQAGVVPPPQSSDPPVGGQQAASAVLAASLVNKDGIGLPSSASTAILRAFGQQGFVQVSPGSSVAQATLAVVFTPPVAQSPDPQAKIMSQVLVAVAGELRSASLGAVLAGGVSGIGPDSAIAMEGGSGPASSVDNADTPSGQIMVVQALRRLLDHKAPAAYGLQPGTAPSPAPTPTASASPQ
jgi:cell division protein FtsB